LPGLPDSQLKCGAKDFTDTLREYYLTDGLNYLLEKNLPVEAIR